MTKLIISSWLNDKIICQIILIPLTFHWYLHKTAGAFWKTISTSLARLLGCFCMSAQEISVTDMKSLLELPILIFPSYLFYNFPAKRYKFVLIRIMSCIFKRINIILHFLSSSCFINTVLGKISGTSQIWEKISGRSRKFLRSQNIIPTWF